MSQEVDGQKVDARKRKFLIAATSALGGVAVAGVAVPVVMSMMPTARARAEALGAVGICALLGCAPTFRSEIGAADLGGDWPGGFFCPCHGSRFGPAGRGFKGAPAPTNLVISPHQY